MSNDVRGLLRDAATVPSTEADVAGAWRRGRRMRVQRRAVSGLAIVAVVALGSVAVANVVPGGRGASPVAPGTAAPRCDAPSTASDIPAWAASANAPRSIPHLVSPDGNVVAVLFGYPLREGVPTDRQNKILWIVRQPRQGQPLVITATLPGTDAAAVHESLSANSSPGEIYPSIVDVPKPGCWHFTLAWNGHHSAIDLSYVPWVSTHPSVPPTTGSVVPTTHPSQPTTCRTANLTLTLGPPIGSAGHLNYEIEFRNNNTVSSCVMTGFPGVSFVDAGGRQTGVPAQRNRLPYSPVTLAPGATAYAHLSVNDLGNPPCSADAHQIRVYPPNETVSALITIAPMRVCGTSTIDPVLDHRSG
jgi:hypothetical protein